MRESKNIWIINQYLSTPKLGGGGNRSYFIAKELEKVGHEVTLITSSYSHVPKRNYKIDSNFHFEMEEDINLVIVKNIVYKHGRSVMRIISMFIFCIKLFFIPIKKVNQPDFIIVSSISLLPILNAFFFKYRYKNRPKVILELRDIWPLSLVELGNYSRFNPFIVLLEWIEKIAYKNSDYVTCVQPLAYKHVEKIANRSVKFSHVPNGIHIASIEKKDDISNEVKLLIPNNKFIIGYTGAIGVANAMEYFIDAANNCVDPDIYFVVVGEGYQKEELQKKVTGKNIIFIPPIPKSQIQSVLIFFDVLYLGSRKEKIYEFGISAIKTYEYMFARKPILRSGIIAKDEIVESGCGIAVNSEDSFAILSGIKKIKEMSSDEKFEMGAKGFNYVIKHRTFEHLSKTYLNIFEILNNDLVKV